MKKITEQDLLKHIDQLNQVLVEKEKQIEALRNACDRAIPFIGYMGTYEDIVEECRLAVKNSQKS
jgi:hypothetical protein